MTDISRFATIGHENFVNFTEI